MSDSVNEWLLEPHVRHFFAGFPVALAMLSIDGRILAVNTRFTDSYKTASLEGRAIKQLIQSPKAAWEPLSLIARDGASSPALARALPMDDQVMLVLSSVPLEEVSDSELGKLRMQVSQLERLVATDPLTGAWNRAHLDRMIELELNRSARYQQPLSLSLLDIDHFKGINDRYGHMTGDLVLKDLVRVIRAQLRSADLLFRWGGEEFVILTPSTGYRSAAAVAEKLRVAVAEHEFPDVGHVTISLGVAELLPDESAGELFKRVDTALYAAKNSGRNRTEVDRRGSSDEWAKPGLGSVIRLQWSEAYECGEHTIDSEHRELFELANRLIAAAGNADHDRQALSAALDMLLEHVAKHFADEEAILERIRYARLDAHRHAHARLLARAHRLKASADLGELRLGELVEFLAQDVVARHMLGADRDFFPLFAADRVT